MRIPPRCGFEVAHSLRDATLFRRAQPELVEAIGGRLLAAGFAKRRFGVPALAERHQRGGTLVEIGQALGGRQVVSVIRVILFQAIEGMERIVRPARCAIRRGKRQNRFRIERRRQ